VIEDKSVPPVEIHEVFSVLKDVGSPFIHPSVDQHLTHEIVGPGVLMRGFNITDEEAKAIERALNLAFTQGYITGVEQ
jgi:hypothetical protein